MTTMTISKEVLDELLSGVENADDLLGDQGLMKELKVRLMERMLGAELTEHLGYEPDTQPTNQQSNRRNGTSRKTLKGNDGALPIDVPLDDASIVCRAMDAEIAMTMRWPRASSTYLNANASVAGHTKPEKTQDLTCSTISRCSIIRSASTLGMGCCHQQTLKDSNNGSCKASKKLGAIQTFE